MDKINAELLTLTYGALVTRLLQDMDNTKVNAKLETMGYNMGMRMVEEFLAKAHVQACTDFKDAIEMLAKIGFKMFLGIPAEILAGKDAPSSCCILIPDN